MLYSKVICYLYNSCVMRIKMR
ncbi:hypothetical protein Pint_11932 [Pistacia integerrima]|uniref:Uncharacterized protein n=1 Tax=Pistacia integerrima TaxID=434235 RepID=A0ACC0XI71_9ROSI|nr:hypothetical protein Pint_11932 [Pistacia integerrima]